MSMADESQPNDAGSVPVPDSPTPDSSPEPSSAAAPGPAEPAPQPETLIDAVADLLQMLVNWLRQEAAGVMRDKVVLPLQQLGFTLFSACAAVTLFIIGLCFLFVALLLVLAHYLGWPLALTVVGVAILIGAGIFTYQKWRGTQK